MGSMGSPSLPFRIASKCSLKLQQPRGGEEGEAMRRWRSAAGAGGPGAALVVSTCCEGGSLVLEFQQHDPHQQQVEQRSAVSPPAKGVLTEASGAAGAAAGRTARGAAEGLGTAAGTAASAWVTSFAGSPGAAISAAAASLASSGSDAGCGACAADGGTAGWPGPDANTAPGGGVWQGPQRRTRRAAACRADAAIAAAVRADLASPAKLTVAASDVITARASPEAESSVQELWPSGGSGGGGGSAVVILSDGEDGEGGEGGGAGQDWLHCCRSSIAHLESRVAGGRPLPCCG